MINYDSQQNDNRISLFLSCEQHDWPTGNSWGYLNLSIFHCHSKSLNFYKSPDYEVSVNQWSDIIAMVSSFPHIRHLLYLSFHLKKEPVTSNGCVEMVIP